MAAFLDGNLSASETQGISSLIDSDASLQQFMDASSVIDESVAAFSLSDIELPQELQSLNFDLPNLDSDFNGLVTLSPEQGFDDIELVAACADVQDIQLSENEIGDIDTYSGAVVNDMTTNHDSTNIGDDTNYLDLNMDDL